MRAYVRFAIAGVSSLLFFLCQLRRIIFAAPLQREDFLIKYIIKGLRPDSARIIGVTRPLMRHDLPPIGVSGNNARVTM